MKATWISIAGALALVSQSPSGPQQINLTIREGTSMAAALSPDGRTLMIDLQGSLWTMPATGGAARRLTDEFMDARQPAWAPDAQRVAFQAYRDGVWHIYVMNADGSGVRMITSGPFDDREPSWSRDGSRIAFSSDRSGNYDIWDLEVATGTLRQITRNPANDFGPAWSPAASAIAFVSERDDRRGVWRIDPASGAESLDRTGAGRGERAVVESRRVARDLQRHRREPEPSDARRHITHDAARMCFHSGRSGRRRRR